jgi:hypothetical protein
MIFTFLAGLLAVDRDEAPLSNDRMRLFRASTDATLVKAVTAL